MLRLLSSMAEKCKKFWKPSKPRLVGIHWKALVEYFQMSTHLPGFRWLFRVFASLDDYFPPFLCVLEYPDGGVSGRGPEARRDAAYVSCHQGGTFHHLRGDHYHGNHPGPAPRGHRLAETCAGTVADTLTFQRVSLFFIAPHKTTGNEISSSKINLFSHM